MCLCAGHLVFVKSSKIQALFIPRHSKDKASGKSGALLKQRDKVPTPEFNKDVPVYTCTGRLLGGWKREGASPHKCGHAPMDLCGGILENIFTCTF